MRGRWGEGGGAEGGVSRVYTERCRWDPQHHGACGQPRRGLPLLASITRRGVSDQPPLVRAPHTRQHPQAACKEEAVRKLLVAADTAGSGALGDEAIADALARAGLRFTQHQLLTLRRRLDRGRTGVVATQELLAALGLSGDC